jgi:hypothetical protein
MFTPSLFLSISLFVFLKHYLYTHYVQHNCRFMYAYIEIYAKFCELFIGFIFFPVLKKITACHFIYDELPFIERNIPFPQVALLYYYY